MDGQLPQPNIQLFSSLLTSLLLVSPFRQSRYSAHVRCPSAALTPLSALPFTFFTSFILPSLINIEALASKNDFWPYQNENSARINSIIKKVLLRNSQLCPGLWSIVSCKNVVRCKSHQVFPQQIVLYWLLFTGLPKDLKLLQNTAKRIPFVGRIGHMVNSYWKQIGGEWITRVAATYS